MRNYLTLDGVDSTDFGLYISGPGTFSAPAREYQTLQIPGRSGDLIVKADRLQNGELVYPAFICRDFDHNISSLRAFLLSKTTYMRLEDSYHPDEYRMGIYQGPFEPEVNHRLSAAKFDLVFNVKPQRFLKSGETMRHLGPGMALGATYRINNPTRFRAMPILRLYGNGLFIINTYNSPTGGHYAVKNNNNRYIDIDCELMECYTGATGRNQDLTANDTLEAPCLEPGRNTLWLYNFTDSYIIPRWWTV